jgi:hypothetical protein
MTLSMVQSMHILVKLGAAWLAMLWHRMLMWQRPCSLHCVLVYLVCVGCTVNMT